MFDYVKTEQIYDEIGQKKKFEETAEYNRYRKEKTWFDNVRSKRTTEYYQSSDLMSRELVSNKWMPPHVDNEGKPLEYPLKYVDGIYRVRIADGSEWLLTTEQWYGLDVYGNALNICMNFKQRFDNIRPVYANKAKNPRDRDPEMILDITSIKHEYKYTLPFTPENFDKLYAMRNGKCVLVLKDETQDKSPYEIPKADSFRNSSFEELFEWAAIPQTKLDRSYGDNLNNTHIG